MQRLLVALCLVGLFVVLDSSRADAHNLSGPSTTNFKSKLISISPSVSGLSVRLKENGDRVQLTNSTGHDVTILGYNSEPYLRIGPLGIYENVNSPAVYLNESLFATTHAPANADPKSTPNWQKIKSGTTVVWHDHRTHWMTKTAPSQVVGDPQSEHILVPSWTLPIDANGQSVVATGSIGWTPAPSPWPWILGAVAILALSMVVGHWFERRYSIAALVMAVVFIDMVHTALAVNAMAGTRSDQLIHFIQNSLFSVIIWLGGLTAVWFLLQRNVRVARLCIVFVGSSIALIGGLGNFGSLHRSHMATTGPYWLTRTIVMISIGLGSGLLVTALSWRRINQFESPTRVDRESVSELSSTVT